MRKKHQKIQRKPDARAPGVAMEAGELLSRTLVYPADDVDALLARIRAAVDAEREAVEQDAVGFARGTGGRLHAVYSTRAALDALLADGG